jgi:16S rRNA (guanine(966)-N(2))-methyltransferase RsmD
MRVIAGEFKGRRLVTPRGNRTRPTADQVRTAALDALMPWLAGAHVLDLFAGAGGVGIEALSRGAAHATFVERDPQALRALESNIGELPLGGRTRVLRTSVSRGLEILTGEGARHAVVFLDPPYEDAAAVTTTLEELGAGALVAPGGIVIAQHLTKQPAPSTAGALHATRTRRFGETTLTFLRPSA